MEALYLVCGARRPQLKRNPLDGAANVGLLAFIVVGTIALSAILASFFQRRREARTLDPNLALIEDFEFGLMLLIRQRYRCTHGQANEVRKCFEQWQMDAIAIPIQVAPDGLAVLSEDVMNELDHCALKNGLHRVA